MNKALFLCLVLSGCASPQFTTDGCSGLTFALWKVLIGPPKVEPDCVKHDYAYWKGGTAEERLKADLELKADVAKRGEGKDQKKYEAIGSAMYYGVRIGGAAWLPTPWRWGYRFPYFASYKNDEGQ